MLMLNLPSYSQALHQLRLTPTHDPKLARPLYLGIKEPARLVCEGPHGVVASSANRRQRIPLGRIDRIVLGTHASFTPDALRRCLVAGVSIHFVDEQGDGLGYAWGKRAVVPGRASLLERAQEDVDWWPHHYAQWIDNIERAQVARALLGLGHGINRCDAAHGRTVLAARFQQRHHECARALFHTLDEHLRGFVSHTLYADGWFCRPYPQLTNRLIDDFTRVLGPTAYRYVVDNPLPSQVVHCIRNTEWLARNIVGNPVLITDLGVISHLLEKELSQRYG
ncbi:MAG: CRISPR-associated endonuclease Cas1 [Casimicrobiaceae bacterium]